MTQGIRRRHRTSRQAGFHAAFSLLVMLSISLNAATAQAAGVVPAGVRVAKVVHKFDDLWQYGAIYKLRPPRRLRARCLELAVGALATSAESRPYVSLGPVWSFPSQSQALFLELGFSVTLLGGSTLDGRDLGGNLHFTSAAAVGTRFGARREFALALRIQHMSNGGLHDTNPGVDAIALNFSMDLPGL